MTTPSTANGPTSATTSADSAAARVCTIPARCPICGAPNACRMETGEAYKGPCWCERLTLPDTALRRLSEEIPESRCLCPTCLQTLAENPEIPWPDLAAPTTPERGHVS